MENIEWEDPLEKESHPNKCLYCHVDEVKRIFKKFIDFYRLSKEKDIIGIIEEVISYHDYGKLHPEWGFGKGIPHSNRSAQYYLEQRKNLCDRDLLVAFLILHHHGTLRPQTAFNEFKKLEEAFSTLQPGDLRDWFFQEFPFKRRVSLADAYGLFKLADCLSASGNASFLLQKPKLSAMDLKKFLPDDEKRRDQEPIMNIGKVGFLRAPTGWGKTIASPFYFLSKDIKKVFFIFPTITAINKLFHRFSKLFEDEIGKYFYFYDVEVYGKDYEVIDANRKVFLSKHFFKPYMITSVDQLLLSFLQVGDYHLKRVMFRDSAIIVDEVHLLNERMLYLLLHFIKKFWNIYNFYVLFMSATLPNGLKEAIEEFLEVKIDDKDFVDKSNLFKKLNRVKVEVRSDECLMDAIDEIIRYGEENKVLVICNTVGYAVKLKREIEKKSPIPSLLLHARFNYNSRKEIEEKIEGFEEIPHILVTTQVCEVSLDISYDYLFTELAPLPSLIQRFGRINRRGKYTDRVNVYVFKPYIEDKKFYPYEEEKIEEAKKILEEIRELKSEYQLIERLNDILPKDKVLKGLEEAKGDLKLETVFENQTKTGYFFTLDLSEDEAQKLLSYREDFTTLIIPYGRDIIPAFNKEAVKICNEIEKLCELFRRRIEKGENVEAIIAKLKGYAVQVPFYCVRDKSVKSKIGLPIVEKARNFIYHVNYGFVKEDLVTESMVL